MGLTQGYLPGLNQTKLDLAHLPRRIDKAQASNQIYLGKYINPYLLDKIFLNFIKTNSKEHAQQEKSPIHLRSWFKTIDRLY